MDPHFTPGQSSGGDGEEGAYEEELVGVASGRELGAARARRGRGGERLGADEQAGKPATREAEDLALPPRSEFLAPPRNPSRAALGGPRSPRATIPARPW
ncbi:hypothetical protein ZWY2020_006492 [Hordeum vulgare]|nr:hypothetical protein ZWY2020_006492 [Hordeum vulgare]